MARNTTPPPVSKLSPPCGTLLLLASTAAVVSRADYYRFQLTHVDANLGLSIDELMRRAYDRTRLRAATLYDSSTSDSDVDTPILSPAYLNKAAAEYFMKFYMGQRTDATSAVVDTGSNLIWDGRIRMPQVDDEIPAALLQPLVQPAPNCRCTRGTTCEFDVKYGGNEGTHHQQTEGVLWTDSLAFLAPHKATDLPRFDDIAIGCATRVEFHDPSIKGIVGLGRGDQSLPGQLKISNFSYCLSSYTAPEPLLPISGYLLIATAPDMATGARSGATLATTGLLRNDSYKAWYFVDLQDIQILGGTDHLDIALTVPGAGACWGRTLLSDELSPMN